MLNNDASREAAAKEFTAAPKILGEILRNERNSPKHRIDAAREIRTVARVADEKFADDVDRVRVVINLGADVKPIVVDSGPLPP